MKKILITILLLTASTLIYSQSMDLNHKKVHIVDSTMGLGITPTSRLHVFGNGTASNLFNVTNDKDATKDSSVVVTSNGSFCSGTNTPAPLTKNTFVIKDDANIGITNTLWIDSTTIDSNRLHINVMKSLNTLNPVKGIFGIGGATYGNIYDAELANSFFISSYSGNLHFANEMYPKMTIATNGVGIGTPTPNASLHVKDRWQGAPALTFIAGNDIDQTYDSSTVIDYFGKVGIGISAPTSRLHVFGNGTTSNLLNITNDKDATKDSSVVIKSRGYVGIGTTTPAAKLHIDGNKITPNDLVYVTNDKDDTKDSTFAIKSNGFVAIGSNTAYHPLHVWGSGDRDNIHSEYSGSYDRAAIQGRALGSAGYGIKGTAITIGAMAGFFENTASGIALDLKSDNGIAIRVRSGDVIVDSTRFHSPSTTLSDNEAYYFPTNISWKGEIDVDSLGYTLFTAQIRCDANGTPYLEGVSWKRWSSKTYVEVGSTDGYLNITDGGSGMVITNTLGYTIKATLRFRTKQ